jgi:hypothetical protein
MQDTLSRATAAAAKQTSIERFFQRLGPWVYEVEVLIGLRCCSKAWLVRSAASCEHGVPGQALSVTHVVLLHL